MRLSATPLLPFADDTAYPEERSRSTFKTDLDLGEKHEHRLKGESKFVESMNTDISTISPEELMLALIASVAI